MYYHRTSAPWQMQRFEYIKLNLKRNCTGLMNISELGKQNVFLLPCLPTSYPNKQTLFDSFSFWHFRALCEVFQVFPCLCCPRDKVKYTSDSQAIFYRYWKYDNSVINVFVDIQVIYCAPPSIIEPIDQEVNTSFNHKSLEAWSPE